MAYSKSMCYEHDQKKFDDYFYYKYLDSISFLRSVKNSVEKNEFYKSRPKSIQKDLAGRVVGRVSASIETRKSMALAESNRALLHVEEVLRVGDLNLSWDDESLCNWAENRSASCSKLISNDEFSVHVLKWIVNGYGLRWPSYDKSSDCGAVARLCCAKWWRRQARTLKVRAIDQLARNFKMVHARAQSYASDEAVFLRRRQVRRNRSLLEALEAVNQDGDAYTLAELSDLSVSNPTLRRHELMVRMRGFEQLAEQFGWSGLFVTLSAPSKFHPMRQVKNARGRLVRVEENEKYCGATPRDAQAWLNKTWQLIRAEFDRKEIKCFGFRVVEPHADGCPHWHMLLFFADYDFGQGKFYAGEFYLNNLALVKAIYKKYSLRTDGDERGASKYRLKIVDIDKEKGSAAGYIAKYIAKSIDGSHIDDDLLGNSGVAAAERICASASSWGLRQFQQIGGGSVTVWRELRRMDVAEGVVEEARLAADASDWAAYCLVQSGGLPCVTRKVAKVRPAYWFEHDAKTGEVIDECFNKYGEASAGRLFGVEAVFECKYFLSRFYSWVVQRVGATAKTIRKALPVCTMSPDDLLDLLRGDGLNSAA